MMHMSRHDASALFNPVTSIVFQKCHPYTGNVISETLGDSQNALLHWGDVLGGSLVAQTDAIAEQG